MPDARVVTKEGLAQSRFLKPERGRKAVDEHQHIKRPQKDIGRQTKLCLVNAQRVAALVLCHSGTSSANSLSAASASCAAIAVCKASS